MYRNVKHTYRGIVFAQKPIVLCRSRCRRRRGCSSSLVTGANVYLHLKQFSIECRKTKTKVITLTTTDTDNPMNQLELKANTCSRRQARENACRQDKRLVLVLLFIG